MEFDPIEPETDEEPGWSCNKCNAVAGLEHEPDCPVGDDTADPVCRECDGEMPTAGHTTMWRDGASSVVCWTCQDISTNPDVMCGVPCIKGTRIPVTTIKSFYDAGYTDDQILAEYPTLTRSQICAAYFYKVPPQQQKNAIHAGEGNLSMESVTKGIDPRIKTRLAELEEVADALAGAINRQEDTIHWLKSRLASVMVDAGSEPPHKTAAEAIKGVFTAKYGAGIKTP